MVREKEGAEHRIPHIVIFPFQISETFSGSLTLGVGGGKGRETVPVSKNGGASFKGPKVERLLLLRK